MNGRRDSMFSAVLALLIAVPLVGCGPEDFVIDEDAAPAGEELGTVEGALTRPVLRIPFRCGQVWVASTWSGHSPTWAVDWNRDNDFGDAVIASAGGTVTRSESEGNTSYGHWVEIAHANGYRTR